MLFLEVLLGSIGWLLFHLFTVSCSSDLKFSCSIVHNLPIASDRKLYSSAYNVPAKEEESEAVCIIASVTINSTGSSVTFPAQRSIELFHPRIPFIGPNLFRQLNDTTVNLELRKGSLSELYYGLSRLESLKVSDTGLQVFDVLPEPHLTLHTLIIHEPRITTLAANVRYLVRLKLLDLSSCSLETVDLGSLESLRSLRVLNLADNQLTTIGRSDDVQFPELILFDVRHNQLTVIDGFPDMFPLLTYTRIMENRWDCEWVSEIRAKVWTRNVTVLGTDFQCAGRMSNGGLCCSYSSPARARLAISRTIISVLDELGSGSEGAGDATKKDSIADGLKLKVFENQTVDGVIGLEMDNVGVYLREPLNRE